MIVTDDSFEEKVLRSKLPVLVEFCTTRCEVCRMMLPILEAIATEVGSLLQVALVDIDHNPKTASAFSVVDVPSLFLFKDGHTVMKSVGLVPMKSILDRIAVHLAEP